MYPVRSQTHRIRTKPARAIKQTKATKQTRSPKLIRARKKKRRRIQAAKNCSQSCGKSQRTWRAVIYSMDPPARTAPRIQKVNLLLLNALNQGLPKRLMLTTIEDVSGKLNLAPKRDQLPQHRESYGLSVTTRTRITLLSGLISKVAVDSMFGT